MEASAAKTPKTAFSAMPATATASQRPRLPPRASSERVRATPMAPLRATGSVRSFVRLASMQEERVVVPPPARRGSSINRMPFMRRNANSAPSIAPFVRAMSSVLRLNIASEKPIAETFRCHICFDDVGVSEAVTLSTCGHKYCESCFKPYLELKITEGNVRPVCFHPIEETDNANGDTPTANVTCGVAVSEDQIKAIVDPEIFKKYEYFRFNQEHQHARECPYCSHSQDCAGPENPICVCEQCSKTFCFFHGNAHEDGTCADYELKNAQEEALNRAKIDEIAKPCPGCHRDVEKNGGCNHMKCIGCNTSFCWLCGEIIEDAPMPSHYAEGAEGGCSGRQFDGMEPQPYTWQTWVVIIVLSILAIPISCVLAAIIAPFAWCCNRDKGCGDVFLSYYEKITVVLCTLIMFVLGPLMTLVSFFVDVLEFIFFLLLLLVDAVCCCGRFTRDENDAVAEEEDAVDNDLEIGLVEHEAETTRVQASAA